MRCFPQLIAAGLLFSSVCGCTSLLTEGSAAGAGIVGAAASRAVTHNAGVTTGIGLGVQAAARAGLQYAERRVHQTEQDQIAAVAGTLPVGAVAHWQVVHDIPIEANQHGEVTVSRAVGSGVFTCKEIVFSIDQAEHERLMQEFYTATVCRDRATWKWATAEPATERWGALQ